LKHLERNYNSPVDMEFTIQLLKGEDGKIDPKLYILQCRPQSQLQDEKVELPKDLEEERIIFSTSRVSPHGQVNAIRYVLFVTPEGYFGLPSLEARTQLTRAIGQLNKVLEGEVFICVGPGRWGTVNTDLGVRVGYADIYNTRALVEVSGQGVGSAPEPSYGTHFFQDLIESKIFPLAVHLDDEDTVFNRAFFYETENSLTKWLPELEPLQDSLRLLSVEDYARDSVLELIMDSDAGKAVAYLREEERP
jgi:hypothetical protein